MVTPNFGAWATNVGQNTNFDVTDWAVVPSGFELNGTQRLELGEGDAEKITYFTPRIAGLQFGASYMPSGEEDKNSSIAPTTVDLRDGWAIATNYRAKFGGVGLGLAAGYASAKQPGGTTGPDFEGDPKGWAVGGKVSFVGVTLAAGYMSRKSIAGTGTGANEASDELSFGAKYDFGKNHVSAGYLYGEAGGTKANTKDDEADRLMVSYRRDLAKGIQYRLNLIYADFVGEDAGKGDDNEAIAVTTGIRVAF
jgi:predicted porin